MIPTCAQTALNLVKIGYFIIVCASADSHDSYFKFFIYQVMYSPFIEKRFKKK